MKNNGNKMELARKGAQQSRKRHIIRNAQPKEVQHRLKRDGSDSGSK